jgi:hypothetical protein
MLNKSVRQWLKESEPATEENTTALATAIFSDCGFKIGDIIPEFQLSMILLDLLVELAKGRRPDSQERIKKWMATFSGDDLAVLKDLILDALKEGNLNKMRQLGA